jgi:adenine/guanine phosphoribosyltransferase-like PRPP-binding protein
VTALETSGFYIGPIVASNLRVSFVPIRRGSHIPKTWNGYIQSDEKIISATKGTVEHFIIPNGSLDASEEVLLVDDFLRTGKALFGGIDVISKAGGKVEEVFAVIDIFWGKGREDLESNGYKVSSLISLEKFEIMNCKKARLFIRELFFKKTNPESVYVDVALRKGQI